MAIKEIKKWKEHETIKSRITHKDIEVKFVSPNSYYGAGGSDGNENLVPKNPFASRAQEGYMHAHPDILGDKLKEWDSATKGKKLPEKVKK
jgi:hypothetical protein